MDESDKLELLKQQWILASEIHRHEDNLIWQRFSYFVILVGGLFALIASLIEGICTRNFVYIVFSSISLFTGGMASFVFFAVLRRGQAYQKRWLDSAKESEAKISSLIHSSSYIDPASQLLTLYTINLEQHFCKTGQSLPSGARLGRQELVSRLVFLTAVGLLALAVLVTILLLPMFDFVSKTCPIT